MKMPASTLKALKGSIRKWESIVAGTGEDKGRWNCPLCKQFNDQGCVGCPVMKRTGVDYCSLTPYVRWSRYQKKREHTRVTAWIADTPKALKLAKAELRFLKSLLPSASDG